MLKPEPHNAIKAEQSVIGSLMIDPNCTEAVAAILRPSDFYRDIHGEVFDALVGLREKRVEPDPITVTDALDKNGVDTAEWGGFGYLHACIEEALTAANAEHHARIVKEKSRLRAQAGIGLKLTQLLSKADADPSKVRAWLSEQVDSLHGQESGGARKLSDLLMPHYELLAGRKDQRGLAGFSTGLTRLDNITNGFGGNLFVLLKGSRGSGKTHVLLQWCVNCVRSGRAAVLFSLDTPLDMMLNRLIAHVSGVDSFRLAMPREDDWGAISRAAAEMWEWPLYIYDEPDVAVTDIAAQCKALAGKGLDIGLIGIDYAEVVGVVKPMPSREQELAQISIRLRNLVRSLGCTLVLLSQVNDDGKERYSRSLGNNCDLLAGMETATKQSIKFWTEKNRKGPGASFMCDVDFRTGHVTEQGGPQQPWWI